ncbi:hypothetical protein VV869_06950 [Photobacterium sp. MCCC 1A19761]|uniref:hypothetical protein n=1 Tax=Photobacterium sp. MCCC 1A19761 TaxID=3115000 RepID=UPI00307D35A4
MTNTRSSIARSLSVKSSAQRWFISLSLPLVLLAMMLTPQANASLANKTATPPKETVERINAIQRDLTSIRQQAMQSNPELAAQAKQLEQAFEQKAKDIGYDPEAFVTQAQEIQTKIQTEQLSKEERSELIQSFIDAKNKMAEQRQQMISDKQLMGMQEKLQQETLIAMKDQDPNTEALVKELNTLVEQIQ